VIEFAIQGPVAEMRILWGIICMVVLTVGGFITAYAAAFDLCMLAYLTTNLDHWRVRFYFMSGSTVLIGILWVWSFYRFFVCKKPSASPPTGL
jgi:hypothetical protein